MTMTYARWVSNDAGPEAVAETEKHVRAHLSSVADPIDDGERYADDVDVVRRAGEDGTTVTGRLDRDGQAPYLWAGFDPDGDAGRYAILAAAEFAPESARDREARS